MKHTQQEWKVSEFHPDLITCDNRNICQVFGWAGHHGLERPDNGSEESKANRSLIITSPELLEVLKEVFEEVNISDTSLELYKKVEQAIKKATA